MIPTTAPAYVLRSDRFLRIYWASDPAAEPDAFGCTPHTTLTIDHDNKTFRAVLSSAPAAFLPDGTHREALTMGTRPRRELLRFAPAPRFSRERFATFAAALTDIPTTA